MQAHVQSANILGGTVSIQCKERYTQLQIIINFPSNGIANLQTLWRNYFYKFGLTIFSVQKVNY